jgi:hypothetical protein
MISAELSNTGVDVIAMTLLTLALCAALAVIVARSFFVIAAHLTLIGLACAGALLAGGDGRGAAFLLAVCSGWGAFVVVAASLLSTRAQGPIVVAASVLPAIAGCAVLAMTGFGFGELRRAPAEAMPLLAAYEGWIAFVILAGGLGVLGALGYGERGALEPSNGAVE